MFFCHKDEVDRLRTYESVARCENADIVPFLDGVWLIQLHLVIFRSVLLE